MPLNTINYNNTIIYKIICKDINIKDIYVGHTTSFKDRKREHKSRINKNYKFKIYETIRNNGGWDNWEMIEIEKYPCKDSNEARTREKYHCELLKSNLNMYSPVIDIEKLKSYRKDYLKKYNARLSEEQKNKKKQYNIIYKNLTFVCSCNKEIKNLNKYKHLKSAIHRET